MMSSIDVLKRLFRPLLAGCCALMIAAASPDSGSASAMVTHFHEQLVGAVKASSGKDFAVRSAAFRSVVEDNYDTRFMIRVASGSYWDGLTPQLRDQLTAALGDLTAASYASRFKAYNGQQFSVIDEKPAAQNRVLVRAQILRKSGTPTNISYLLEKTTAKQGWSIVDVWLNNTVSELALRRSEFSPVLRDKGGDALLTDLRSRIAALPKDDAAKIKTN